MQFLEANEIAEWCQTHDIALDEHDQPLPDSAFTDRKYLTYAEGERSGREAAVATTVVDALGVWEECLLRVTLVGIWSSSEDWPHYYALRGKQGERRSWDVAPGHLFSSEERTLLITFLTATLENGWDAFVLPSVQGHTPSCRAVVSHDEWIEIQDGLPATV